MARLRVFRAALLAALLWACVGVGRSAFVLARYKCQSQQRIDDAYDYVENNCRSIGKLGRSQHRLSCMPHEQVLNELVNPHSGERLVWTCAWGRLLEDHGLCTSEGCTSTWHLGALRLTLTAAGVVVILLGVIYVLVRLEQATEATVDRRSYGLPVAQNDYDERRARAPPSLHGIKVE